MPSLASYRLLKRLHIINLPVTSPFAKRVFHVAKLRLRGLFLLTNIIKEIRLYGAICHLTNQHRGCYNLKLSSIVTHKTKAEIKDSNVDSPRCLFYPNQPFIIVLSLLSVFALLLSITFEPYAIGFLEETAESRGISLFIDCVFMTEILVTFNLAFITGDDQLVCSRRKIATNYLTSGFAVDVMTVFPFYLISSSNSNQLFGLLRVFRLLKLLKARRLTDFLKRFEQISYFKSLNKQIQENLAIVRLVGFLCVVFILLHISACIWHFVARFEENEPETWVTAFGLRDKPNGIRYLSSLYFSMAVFTTVGYGDILPVTSSEKIFTTIWLFFGVGLYSFFISSISSLLTASSIRRATLNDKLIMYSVLSKDMRLSDDLAKVIAAVVADEEQTTLLSFKQRHAAVRFIPKTARVEVATSAYEGAVNGVPFLSSQNSSFLSNIVPLLKYRRIERNSWVYTKGEFAEEIFFLVKGRINYITNGYIFKTMVQGAYFGEIEVLDSTARAFGVSSEEDSEMLVMDLDVKPMQLFAILKRDLPTVVKEMELTAAKRRTKNIVSMQEVITTLDLVQVQRDYDLKDLAGKKLACFQRSLEVKSLKVDHKHDSMSYLLAEVEALEATAKDLRAKLAESKRGM
jgi:CRP-like cAMP-binding protein